MDWLVVILVALASAGLTGGVVYLNARAAAQPVVRRLIYTNKWRLPPPGTNLELYRRTTSLLNTLERERDEARLQCEEIRTQRDEAIAKRDLYEAKLGSAQDILRSWTHSGMEIRIRERPKVFAVTPHRSSNGTVTLA